MSKDKIADYDGTTAGNNTDIGGISIAEGMLPSAVNNSMRELTKQLGAFANGTDAIDALTVTGAATVNGAFTSLGIDDNANANAITIDSSENVGISTTAPVSNLEIEDGGTSNSILTKITADDQTPYGLMIGNDTYSATDTNAFGFLQRNDGTAYIYNGGGLRAAFHNVSGGVLSLEGGVVLGAGAANSTTANLMSDYEEGTFNPIFQQGISVTSYSAQNGRYTKVGRLVTAEIDLDVNVGSANNSHLYIGGLPFTSLAGAPYGVGSISYNGGWYNANFSFLVLANTTFLAAYRQSDGGAVGGNDLTAFNGTIRVTAIYTAA